MRQRCLLPALPGWTRCCQPPCVSCLSFPLHFWGYKLPPSLRHILAAPKLGPRGPGWAKRWVSGTAPALPPP